MNESLSLKLHYHPKQKAIFFDSQAKVKIIAKGRRFGLTKGFANYSMEEMLAGVSPVLWVDAVNTNIDRYVERYFIPELRQLPIEHWKWRQQKKELTIFDRKCDFRSADRPELIEGFAYRLIILNEAGIILKDEYLWENTIRPMIMDFNPDQLIGGTPKGRNLFHDLKVKAEDDKDPRYADWEFFHFTSYDNPFIGKEQIDELVADMPEHVCKQEIFAKFLEDAASVFRNVGACIRRGESENEPPKEGVEYVLGWDLAKHVDFTVITVLEAETGRQVFFERLNKLDWPYQIRLVIETAKRYNEARICMDSTGAGDPVYDQLVASGVPVDGYKFTSDSKRKLVETTMLSFEHEEFSLLDIKVQENELNMFGFEVTASGFKYSAPEGKHDDCVIALCLANWIRKSKADWGQFDYV